MSWMFSRTVFGWFFAVMVGAFVGLGLFTFWYARGESYLTDDPRPRRSMASSTRRPLPPEIFRR